MLSRKLRHPFRIDPVNLNLTIYNYTKASTAARQNGDLVETRMKCGNESQLFVRAEGITTYQGGNRFEVSV